MLYYCGGILLRIVFYEFGDMVFIKCQYGPFTPHWLINVYYNESTSGNYNGSFLLSALWDLESSRRKASGHTCEESSRWTEPPWLWVASPMGSGPGVQKRENWEEHHRSLLPECGCYPTCHFKPPLPWLPCLDEPYPQAVSKNSVPFKLTLSGTLSQWLEKATRTKRDAFWLQIVEARLNIVTAYQQCLNKAALGHQDPHSTYTLGRGFPGRICHR